MRHYLTEQEFKDFLLNETRREELRFELLAEDDCGDTSTIQFKEVSFTYRIFLYTLPMTLDVGLIQEDIDNGWDNAIHDVWMDITDMCGWKPFVNREDDNMF